MEFTANLMIFYGISRKFYKFHGKQQNAMANLETGAYLVLVEPMKTHPDMTEKLLTGTNRIQTKQ